MAGKNYTANDIKLVKPKKEYIDMVDISRAAFEKNLESASSYALEFARTLVINDLPDGIRYVVLLGASYDESQLEEGEYTFPEDYEHRERCFYRVSDIVDLLWRNGKVPEWVNVFVESATQEYTNIKLECCGRFSDKVEYMYHAHEGRAPFHVLGPPMPVGGDFSSQEGKYQL